MRSESYAEGHIPDIYTQQVGKIPPATLRRLHNTARLGRNGGRFPAISASLKVNLELHSPDLNHTNRMQMIKCTRRVAIPWIGDM